ncbi:unnamed protein product, partial [Mycena citricolor]
GFQESYSINLRSMSYVDISLLLNYFWGCSSPQCVSSRLETDIEDATRHSF